MCKKSKYIYEACEKLGNPSKFTGDGQVSYRSTGREKTSIEIANRTISKMSSDTRGRAEVARRGPKIAIFKQRKRSCEYPRACATIDEDEGSLQSGVGGGAGLRCGKAV